MTSFGPHLTLDMRGCDRWAIQDLNTVAGFLTKLPDILGMTIIDPPKVIKYSGLVPEDWGVTGVVTIAESHIAFHSFVEKEQYVFLDVFSCRSFDIPKAVEFIVNTFSPEHLSWEITERGIDFPR